ncbi:MAG: hypothetical protein R6X29_11900 [Acidimicrobiia bacterium]
MAEDQDWPEGWEPGSWVGRLRCEACDRSLWYHLEELPSYVGHQRVGDPPPVPSLVFIRGVERERRGEYAAPLPPPGKRRRIREAAGLDLEEVASMVWEEYQVLPDNTKKYEVVADTVSRWEKAAGYDANGKPQ